MRSIIVMLAGLAVLAVVIFIVAQYRPAPAPQPDFTAEGNLVINNPGLTPGAWYLVYEKPGSPGLSKQLLFDQQSMCDGIACDTTKLGQGARVRIAGFLSGALVRVATLTTLQAQESGTPVNLFFYDLNTDKDASGNVMCSKKGLVAVKRVLPAGATPADAVKLLLRGELTDEERAQGITTEFPLLGVTLASSTEQKGTLTLTFTDPQHKTGGGSCRVAILWTQIEATAKQFPGITAVRFSPSDLFQP